MTSGKSFAITCRTTKAHPAASIQWYIDDDIITSNVNSRILWNSDGRKDTVSELSMIPNRGEFGKKLKCKSNHDVQNNPQTIIVNIIVQYSAAILNDTLDESSADQGQNATIVCESMGYPIPDIKWYTWTDGSIVELMNSVNKIMIKHEQYAVNRTIQSTLYILNVIPKEDHGVYTCHASNIIGSDNYNITLAGRSKPTVEYNLETGKITWTQHENTTYKCVKIEKKNQDNSWSVIKDCEPNTVDQLEYTVDDANAEYRVTYCTLNGDHCLREYIDVQKIKVPPPKYEMTITGMLITCGVLIIIDIVLLILISRIKPQNNSDAEMVCSYSGADNPCMVTSEIMRTSPPKGTYSNKEPSTSSKRKRPKPAAASLDIDDVYVQENKHNQVHGKAKDLKMKNKKDINNGKHNFISIYTLHYIKSWLHIEHTHMKNMRL
ncbi:uncharacterized protein LOC102809866 [Saccoglossus kowalevskii]